MKGKFVNKITRSLNVVKLKLKKHAPTIMTVAGVTGCVGGAVMACKATLKLEDTLEECGNEKRYIEEMYATHADYTENEFKKDLATQTCKNAIKVGKLYAPSVCVGAISVSLILSGNNIQCKRNASLAAAYATVDAMYKKYRKNVVDTLGEDVDNEMRYGIRHEKVDEVVTDDNGKEHKVKKTVDVMDADFVDCDYSRFFDSSCVAWEKNLDYNIMFLESIENYANQILRTKGYLFLNELWDMIGPGMEKTDAGQEVGWIYSDSPEHKGANCVDLRIKVLRSKTADGEEYSDPVILIDPNVDGTILYSPLLKFGRNK